MISAGPFWDDTQGPERRETALHPFWRRVETPESTRIQVLPPISTQGMTARDVDKLMREVREKMLEALLGLSVRPAMEDSARATSDCSVSASAMVASKHSRPAC